MIAIIGGIKTTVNVEMAMPKRDIDKQRKQDEEALLAAGIDMNEWRTGVDGAGAQDINMGHSSSDLSRTGNENPQDERFRQYYEQKMREQASNNYWSEVGLGRSDFGGYSPIASGDDARIKVTHTGCSYNVAKYVGIKVAEAGEAIAADTSEAIATDASEAATAEKPVFISVVGNDALGLAAKCELEAAGVDISEIEIACGTTPISVEIHNPMGDLDFARDDLALHEALTPELLEGKKAVLSKAKAIFVDGTLPVETLDYISDKYSADARIYFDPGSIQGGLAFARSEMKAECVMPGRMESEAMSGLSVLGMDALMQAGEHFEERGVAKTIITLKGGGLYYKEGANAGIIKPEKMLSFADTKGAGDVLSAELFYELAHGEDLEEAAHKAMGAAANYISERNKG